MDNADGGGRPTHGGVGTGTGGEEIDRKTRGGRRGGGGRRSSKDLMNEGGENGREEGLQGGISSTLQTSVSLPGIATQIIWQGAQEKGRVA